MSTGLDGQKCYGAMGEYSIFLCTMLLMLSSASASAFPLQDNSSRETNDHIKVLLEAVESGRIAYKLTDPNGLIAILGEPETRQEQDGGGMLSLGMSYPGIELGFAKSKSDRDAFYTLRCLTIRGTQIDMGGIPQGERQVAVRSIGDFHRIEIENVNLKHLDLLNEGDFLRNKDFDSLTQWPGPEKLPAGFDPKRLLEEGKNPGLGIRALHKEGINGEGVGIAILDQPLLLGHEEYTSRLTRYDATRTSGRSPRSHGSPIVGIAAGRTCGVAPSAFVFYYAAPTTAEHRMQADFIYEVIKYNETASDPGRIRVISISAQPERAPENDAFRRAHKEALNAGILVVTCSDEFLPCGTLTLMEGKNPDEPESYKRGKYAGLDRRLLIPAGNKTLASHQGTNVYT